MVAPVTDSGVALRVYKHGSSTPVDVTNAGSGGFTTLTVTRVRNQPGGLQFSLAATTVKMLSAWLDEAATVELWIGGVRTDIYVVDAYSPRWRELTCDVECAGLLVATKQTPFSGSFTDATGKGVLDALIEQVPEITWDPDLVTGADATCGELVYTDQAIFDAITELSVLLGFDFWVDSDGVFNTAPWATAASETLTLNDGAWDFDTTYSARDIVNRLVLTSDAGSWIYDDAASQALYGIRQRRISATGIVAAAEAQGWAANVLGSLAYPIRMITVLADHDPARVPGALVEVVGLDDGREYLDVISQTIWTLGSLTDNIQIGHQPPTFPPPESIAGKDGRDGLDAPQRAASTLSVVVDGEDLVVTLETSDENRDRSLFSGIYLQKIVAGSWVVVDVDGNAMIPCGEYSFTIVPPVAGTDRYRVMFKGNQYLLPCFSEIIEATADIVAREESLLTSILGWGPNRYLTTDAGSRPQWAVADIVAMLKDPAMYWNNVNNFSLLCTPENGDPQWTTFPLNLSPAYVDSVGGGVALIDGVEYHYTHLYTPVAGDFVWALQLGSGRLILGKY